MAAPAVVHATPVIRQQTAVGVGFVPASRWVDVVSLSASTAGSYTVPSNVSLLRLTPTVVPTYGNLNGAAVIPAAGVLKPGDVLSLICGSACFVTIEAWN